MADIGEPGGELNLHHEFNVKVSQQVQERVLLLVDYINSIANSFQTEWKLINIVTLKEVSNSDYLLNCVSFGEELYRNFLEERLQE